MKEIMYGLLLWISANSGYPVTEELPTVEFRTQQQLLEMQFCAEEKCTAEERERIPNIGIVALFEREKLVLYLDEDQNYTEGENKGYLVHELTHYAQARAKKFERYCIGVLEGEAYDLEDKWRVENGFAKLRRNAAIMMATSCGPGPT